MVEWSVLDRVCQMYAGGARLKDISAEAGVSLAQVCRYLSKARALGDVRARGRRPMDSLSRGEMMRQMFEASDDGFVLFSDVVEMFWPGEMQRPSTWRVLVRLAASFCRKRYGMVLEYDRAREGYVWVFVEGASVG